MSSYEEELTTKTCPKYIRFLVSNLEGYKSFAAQSHEKISLFYKAAYEFVNCDLYRKLWFKKKDLPLIPPLNITVTADHTKTNEYNSLNSNELATNWPQCKIVMNCHEIVFWFELANKVDTLEHNWLLLPEQKTFSLISMSPVMSVSSLVFFFLTGQEFKVKLDCISNCSINGWVTYSCKYGLFMLFRL